MARKRSTKQRPVWKGFLKIGLVSFPVRAFSARAKEQSEVDLDWLHRDCHRRIQYKKVCPVHGEVGQDEIVSGYAVGRGRYVVIEPDELAKLRAKSDKILTVETMIDGDAIDCRYFTDKSYYVLPDGAVADKPYAVIAEAMQDEHRVGVAHVVMFRREQLVLLRVLGDLLMITVLNHEDEFRAPADFARQAPRARASGKERHMATTLIEAMSDDHFEFGKYKDTYVDELRKLIRLKQQGKEVEAPAAEEEPEVANFMDALRQSLERVRTLPARRPSRNGHRRAPRRRKAS
jgi:DNA end-binding protein Ku